MKIKRAASIPLITHDPYFSIWSPHDHLYDGNTEHWSGALQQLKGSVIVDGVRHAFLGEAKFARGTVIPQKEINVTATATEYVFENEKIVLKCRFTSPLLLDDLALLSRPCTYVDFEVEKKDATDVVVEFTAYEDLVRMNSGEEIVSYNGVHKEFNYSYMGKAEQHPLGSSGDRITIDWGYLYLACQEADASVQAVKSANEMHLRVRIPMEDRKTAGCIIAYDDLCSINYFGQWRKGYWTKKWSTIMDAIAAAFADKKETLEKSAKFDAEMEERARRVGGESYVYLCNMSYRHTIAAHKLIEDEEGQVIFLSKENDSNGCIGTVDVSYPSVPLFLVYNAEFVKGMLRPIFKFAACDVWEYDFAPHDVGRYPYAWGQVYAHTHRYDEEKRIWQTGTKAVFPPFYIFPAGNDTYDFEHQMPVEECGNMLIMTAAVCKQDGNADFAAPHWDVLKQWTKYLVEFGADPGEQLCTDDFAGRLAHNVNLSVKAIMGIEAFAILAEMLGKEEEAKEYHKLAKDMAADWEVRAKADDHYMLAFGRPDTWSLKYNMVWDKIWGSNLFSEEVYQTELAYYEKQTNVYGTPLDSRANYTKSDWVLWAATMADTKEQREKLIKPVAKCLEESVNRVPFSDFYQTDSTMFCGFRARSVQGGIFMPMYFEK